MTNQNLQEHINLLEGFFVVYQSSLLFIEIIITIKFTRVLI
ncbi:hypothetical protein [Rummeliibacillus suwonensis]|nr:hypothetical protein [Rummeliibacillus suwonensis]